MRVAQVVRVFMLCSLLATTGWIYAQDQKDDSKPSEEKRPEATKPAPNEAKPARPQDAKPEKQNDNNREEKAVQQDDKARQQNEARPAAQGNPAPARGGQNMQAAGGQRGGHIPDDKFHGSFGREHHFAIHQVTTIQGQPGFAYGGYSFILADGWPAGWAYTDDCYVDYIDGEYFLFDLLHPGVRVALIVVM
ncbi:MAG TPA: hypothetical protein VK828_05430 [Terriglobales bacterium]|jgi:hypothetical protein|nr:hypothetical protein [Terriglobales bacterium]